jgi:hypothetical protein
MSNVIQVPKPSRAAYNPSRLLDKNTLIKAQVEHFREAESNLPEHLRTDVDVAGIRTEGEASQYIRRVTRAIQQSGGRAPEKVRIAE